MARRSDAKLVCSWSATPEMQTKSLWIKSSLLLNRPRIWFREAISAACRASAISSSSWHSEAADVTEELSLFVPHADDVVLEHELVSPSSLVLRSTVWPVRPWSALATSAGAALLLLLFFCDSLPATLNDERQCCLLRGKQERKQNAIDLPLSGWVILMKLCYVLIRLAHGVSARWVRRRSWVRGTKSLFEELQFLAS